MRGRRRSRSEMTTIAATLMLAAAPGALSLCPSDNATIGFSDLASLQTSVSAGNQTHFTLCPNTTFLIDDPLIISANSTIFSCGNDGLSSNNCIFESMAGLLPFASEGQYFTVEGVTFRGVDESVASCLDCIYEDICFSEIESLVTAFEAQTAGQEFRLCPDTLFSMEGRDPLVIHKDGITIRCGESGVRTEYCAFWGGETQIEIQSDGAQLRGLTLLESSRVSVLCSGASGSKAKMEDCEWSGHTGVATVVLYSGTLDDFASYDDIINATGLSMAAEFEMCSFRDNRASVATIANIKGGVLSVDTTYEGNTGEAVITTTGQTSILRSCFVGNTVTDVGVIHIADTSLLTGYSMNYGNGNIGDAAGCFGMYAEDDGSCIEFSAPFCAITSDDPAGEPSMFPSLAPSDRPTNEASPLISTILPTLPQSGTPSISPSFNETSTSPSIVPTLIPSFIPSIFSSNVPSMIPSAVPSLAPSFLPSVMNETSNLPSITPSLSMSPTNLTLTPSTSEQPSHLDDGSCISSWDSILARANTESGGTIVICNATEIDFSQGLEPLQLNTSNVVVDCPSCVFRAGDQHIILQGSVSNIVIRGITFIGAASQSVLASLSIPSSVVFEDCTWVNNSGNAAVRLDNVDFVPPPIGGDQAPSDDIVTDKDDDLFRDRALQDSSQVSFGCDGCVFESNVGQDGILVSSGVSLDLFKVIFDSNQSDKDIVNAENAEVAISSSCFLENRYGDRLLETDFSLLFSELNFGEGNIKTGGLEACDGLGSAVLCLPFEATSCLATGENSTAPTNPPLVDGGPCFSDWDILSDAFADTAAGNKSVFVLCENSVIDATAAILIENDAAVQCGVGGSSDNNCTITGGESHFILKGSAMSVSFVGIKFEKAEAISIRAFAASDSRAIFSHCTWAEHLGPAVVLVYNEIDGLEYTDESVDNLVSSDRPAMNTTFEFCYFHANEPTYGALAVVDGKTEVISSAFEANELMTAGAIVGTRGTELSLLSSCFIKNQALISGTVYLDSLSELVTDKLVFGSANVAGGEGDCQGILESTLDTCLMDGICIGFCSPFKAGACDLPFVDFTPEPTSPPIIDGNSTQDSDKDNQKEPIPIMLESASLNALVIVNILIVILTICGWVYMYLRCKKKHLEPHHKEDGPSNPEAADLLGNLGGKLGFGKKNLPTVIEENDEEEDDDESVFNDEPPKESRPSPIAKDMSTSNLSTMSGMFGGIRQFEEEDSSSDSDDSGHYGDTGQSINSLMLGNSSSKVTTKKKKLRVMKKLKRTINKGKKGDRDGHAKDNSAAGSESNPTHSQGSKLSYGSELENSGTSDVFGSDYDLASMF